MIAARGGLAPAPEPGDRHADREITSLIALIEAHFHIELALSDIVPEHFADVNAVARLVERYLSR